ncbi:HlyD family secretion protein [Pseudoroseicyclus sp. H15]
MAEAGEPKKSEATAAWHRPHLREGLRLSSPPRGGEGRRVLTDPIKGKDYALSETELFLCQSANGQADIATLASRASARFGTPVEESEVAAFFRRLQILGQLRVPAGEQEETRAAVPLRRRAAGGGRRREPLVAPAPPEPKAEEERPRIARLAQQRRRAAGKATAPAAKPASPAEGTPRPRLTERMAAEKRQADAAKAAEEEAEVAREAAKPEPVLPDPPQERNDATESAPQETFPEDPQATNESAPARPRIAARLAARAPLKPGAKGPAASKPAATLRSRPAAPVPAATEEAEPETPAARLAARRAKLREQKERREKQAAEEAAAPPPPEPPKDEAPAEPEAEERPDPLMAIAGNLRRPSGGGGLFDLTDDGENDDDDDDFAGFGLGGPRGRAGGGGGMGGAGMGGGAGGGANRERIMQMLAARQGGGAGAMGGGGMAGALGGGMGGMGMGGGGRAAAGAADPANARPASLKLFNPTWLLRTLYVLFYPLKFLMWAVVPLVVLAGLTLFQNWEALLLDHAVILNSSSTLTLMVISLFAANLTSRLAQGVAILAHGGKVNDFGLMLLFGILPRFYIDRSAIARMDRRGQLWASGAPLMLRLGLFGFGTLGWAISRESGTWLPHLMLLIAQFGLVIFVLTAFPLLPIDGQRWLGVYLGEPRITSKSLAALRHVLFGRPLPPNFQSPSVWPLAMFGIGMVISLVALIGAAGYFLAIGLGAQLGGFGVSIFLGIVVAFLVWAALLKATIGRRMARLQGGGMAAFAAAEQGDPALGRVVDPRPAGERGEASGTARVIWALLIAGLVAVAFLPYEYQAGGPVEILPSARGQAVARSDGEILQIDVAEGDVVQRGDVLAELSSWNQAREVAVTESMLDGARASLQRLQSGAKPEEIELARRELERAESATAFSSAEAERNRELLASGTVSQQAYDRAQTDYENDLATLEVARAQLDLVESGATADEIDIAEAEVERLTRELQFRRDELERTRITAPMDGRVITPGLSLKNGAFLRVGEVLLEIENSDVVNAAISVPESDIALIEPGARVTLRAVGHADEEIIGEVRSIAPAAMEEGFGSVVRVDATFENPDEFLRSGMTGYAKIEAERMRVWEAYLRSFRRFFQVEVWSWIP